MADVLDIVEQKDCAFNVKGEICMSECMLGNMRDFYKKFTGTTINDNKKLIEALKQYLGVDKEFQLLNNRHIKAFVDDDYSLYKERAERFKPPGPWNSVQLLDNNMIDQCLIQWSLEYQSFYPIPFQMIDFYEQDTELAYIDIPGLIKQGYDTFGCVLNTDVSTGGGEHWFCLFVGARDERITIEYFNSSGMNPYYPVHRRMREIGHEIVKSNPGKKVDVVCANFEELQKSDTECGVWSLIYIRSRLKGKPINWMQTEGVKDSDMFKYRKRLFLNE